MDRYEGFAQFVYARGRALSRTAYLLTGDRHLAEDLLQTALGKTALRWPSLRATNPEAYVRRILYTTHVSAWRRKRVPEVLFGAMPEPVPVVNPAEAAVVRVTIARALAQLTRKQRAVLVLRFFEDLSESQTAEVLGIGVGTVKSQTRDAAAKLRSLAPDLAELLESHETVEADR